MPELSLNLGAGDITEVRHAVTGFAGRHGLAGQPLDDFVLAVNEIATNVVRHGGGSGLLRLGVVGATLRCEITDHGPGIPERELDGSRSPGRLDTGGRGLWLARQICEVRIRTGPDGSIVSLSTPVPRLAASTVEVTDPDNTVLSG